MGEAITVRIIPGCPVRVIAENEEERELVEEALANVECGCVIETEAAIEEAAKAALEEATELAAEGKDAEALEVAEEALTTLEEAEEAPEELTCSLEPDKPWGESICGVVAKAAADDVMRRIRPSIERMGRVSEGGQA